MKIFAMRLAMVSRGPAFVLAFVGALALFLGPASATNVEKLVSPGGIEAWLVRDSTVPLIAVQFAFEGGVSQDPPGKPGVANMVSATLDEGAGDLDATAFQEKMEREAIKLSFSADRDHFRGSLMTLSARRAEAFELLRLALNAPRFEAEAVDRIRTQIISQLRRESSDPPHIAAKSWWNTAFPAHPYGWPQKGTEESVAQLASADLKDYARRVFARDQLKIAIVGDIDAATAGAMRDQVFGGLPAKGELTEIPAAKPTALGRQVVVEFNTPQAVVVMGGVGLARKDPDYITAYVVNHVLGGGSFTSRLYTEVREKRGLAYGVYTYLYPLRKTALFMGSTQVRADAAGESLKIIEEEIKRMAESGPTDDELQKAKEYLKGSYALSFDSSTKIAAQLVQIQIEDLGIDYIDKRNGMIEAVTLEQAKRVAKSLLSGGMFKVIVGKPKGVSSAGGPG
jgi:zinc protease